MHFRLAAAAGEEAPTSEPVNEVTDGDQPTTQEESATSNPTETNEQSTSFAQGETFSMPQTQSPYQSGPIPIEGLSLIGSQIQSHATNLSRTLSTKFQEVDAKHNITAKVSEAKHNVEERYHISEKVSDFHTRIVKPAGENVVEKVVPTVREGWGAVSSTVRKSVANLHQETDHNDGAGIDSVDGEVALERNQQPPAATAVDVKQKWASISSAVGSRWSSTAAVLGEKAEVWKEGHMQWREEHIKKSNDGRPAPALGETLSGGMNWVSQRFKRQEDSYDSPVKEQSVVGTLMDMDSRQTDSDGIPSSFFRD